MKSTVHRRAFCLIICFRVGKPGYCWRSVAGSSQRRAYIRKATRSSSGSNIVAQRSSTPASRVHVVRALSRRVMWCAAVRCIACSGGWLCGLAVRWCGGGGVAHGLVWGAVEVLPHAGSCAHLCVAEDAGGVGVDVAGASPGGGNAAVRSASGPPGAAASAQRRSLQAPAVRDSTARVIRARSSCACSSACSYNSCLAGRCILTHPVGVRALLNEVVSHVRVSPSAAASAALRLPRRRRSLRAGGPS